MVGRPAYAAPQRAPPGHTPCRAASTIARRRALHLVVAIEYKRRYYYLSSKSAKVTENKTGCNYFGSHNKH